jgi:hypothetical protein
MTWRYWRHSSSESDRLSSRRAISSRSSISSAQIRPEEILPPSI